MSEVHHSDYSIVNVYKNTLKVITLNQKLYGVLYVLLFLIYALPNLFVFNDININDPYAFEDMALGKSISMVILGLATFVIYLVLYIFITDNVFGTLSRRQYNGGPYTNRIVSLLLPLFGLIILLALFVGIGFIFLIVPGLYIMIKYYVAIPVKIIENKDILGSMKRSAELTDGHKMSIFFTLLILIAIVFGMSLILAGVQFGAIIRNGTDATLSLSPIYVIFSSLLNALYYIVGSIIPATIYYELMKHEAFSE